MQNMLSKTPREQPFTRLVVRSPTLKHQLRCCAQVAYACGHEDNPFRRRCCCSNCGKVPEGSHADDKLSLCRDPTVPFNEGLQITKQKFVTKLLENVTSQLPSCPDGHQAPIRRTPTSSEQESRKSDKRPDKHHAEHRLP